VLEGVARQQKLVARRRFLAVDLEAEPVNPEVDAPVLLVRDPNLELQVTVLAVKIERLSRR
jgi:hypothetical protein